MTLAEVMRDFHDEQACIAFLAKMRWPNGVTCVKEDCQSKHVCKVTSKDDRKKNAVRYLYECLDCHWQFSVKSGTLFHDSHISLSKWFAAIAIVCQAKKGMSANQMGRTIGVSRKTAWYLGHRIREAMNNGDLPMLQGTVEIDETYVGGRKRRNESKESWYERKYPVVGIAQRDGEVRFRKVPRANSKNVKEVVDRCVSPDVHRIVTDESMIYPFMFDAKQEVKRFTIKHAERYADGWIHTNTVESSFANFKRALVGSYHRLSFKHLDRYLNEFEWRQNRKKSLDIFEQALRGIAVKRPLPFRTLVDGEAKSA